MLFQDTFGIDLGTSTVKIYSQRKDEILVEKNMIAIRNKEEILAVGNAAYEMFEKTPHNITVSSTMSYGMIANITNLEIVLHLLLRKISKRIGRKPLLYFTVPTDMSEIEKRAYYTIAGSGDLRKSRVLLVEKPIADAIGLGVPLMKTKGSMLVNIGAESTEISVIADQRVIISKVLQIGGNTLDEALCGYVRKRTNLQISLRTAARLKAALAYFYDGPKEARNVIGVDTISGLPRTGVITAAIVNNSMVDSINRICEEIRAFLERTPPQVHNSILMEGIYLTGGCTRIPNIDRYIADRISCKIQMSSYYDMTTIYGLKEIINHKSLHHWAFTAKSRTRKYK